jgi:NADH-quinone oxidoreductase subunit G
LTKLIVDGSRSTSLPEYTLLQACEAAGAEIPRFCFHERLSIAGNCRMCLSSSRARRSRRVLRLGRARLPPGPNGEPPQVLTKTPTVKKAREGVMEFLLINHPLDCPICDQGGECDLQDQAMAYGIDTTRYHENKRAVPDKYIGPLVATKDEPLHPLHPLHPLRRRGGRRPGSRARSGAARTWRSRPISRRAMQSELQGNVADLCPVGRARPQAAELQHAALGALQDRVRRRHGRGRLGHPGRFARREVMRIEPAVNEAINEEWISDKTRQVVDGCALSGLIALHPRERTLARRVLAGGVRRDRASGAGRRSEPDRRRFVGDLAAVEEIFALKRLMAKPRGREHRRPPGRDGLHPATAEASYLFNATIVRIEQADAILMIRRQPRASKRRFSIVRIPQALAPRAAPDRRHRASPPTWTCGTEYLGAGPEDAGRDRGWPAQLRGGNCARRAPADHCRAGRADPRPDAPSVHAAAARYAQEIGAVTAEWNGFCVLPHRSRPGRGARSRLRTRGRAASSAARWAKTGALDVLYNLGADEIEIAPGAFVIYQGTHGDRGAHRADVILPAPPTPRRAQPTSTPKGGANGQPRLFPAGRRARGLGDSAGAL